MGAVWLMSPCETHLDSNSRMNGSSRWLRRVRSSAESWLWDRYSSSNNLEVTHNYTEALQHKPGLTKSTTHKAWNPTVANQTTDLIVLVVRETLPQSQAGIL